jgi:hypothetical protein
MPIARAMVAACVLAAGTVPIAAQAQEHPPFAATRDAAVTYKLLGDRTDPHLPTEMHMFLKADGGLMRVDASGQPGYAVIDRPRNRMFLVMDSQKAYMEMDPTDSGGPQQFMLNSSMQFQRDGEDEVAGLPCTVWSVQAKQGSGLACITGDGVILRAQGISADGSKTGGLEATAVSYATQPDSLFAPPSGYARLDMGAVLRGMHAPKPSP